MRLAALMHSGVDDQHVVDLSALVLHHGATHLCIHRRAVAGGQPHAQADQAKGPVVGQSLQKPDLCGGELLGRAGMQAKHPKSVVLVVPEQGQVHPGKSKIV